MNNVEKNLYWGHTALHVLQNRFLEHFNEMPTSWGSSTMHCDFTHDLYQTFQSYISCIRNNNSEKQLKQGR